MATNENTHSLYDQQRRAFGVRKLRLFGGLQIGAGGLVFLMSIVGIVLDGINANKYCNYQYEYWWWNNDCRDYLDAPALLGVDIPCLILSAWFFTVGCLPFCMSDVRVNSWRCLVTGIFLTKTVKGEEERNGSCPSAKMKIAFMVCNIISAAAVMPVVVGFGATASTINAGLVFVTTDQQGNVVPMPQSQIPPQYIASDQLAARVNTASSPLVGQTFESNEQQHSGHTYNNYNTFSVNRHQPPPYKTMQEVK